jgi:hypothetical protein
MSERALRQLRDSAELDCSLPRTNRDFRVNESRKRKPSKIPDFLHQALSVTACAAFIKESRMKLVEPTGLNRKSGVRGKPVLPAES